jgi:hypothetical protein
MGALDTVSRIWNLTDAQSAYLITVFGITFEHRHAYDASERRTRRGPGDERILLSIASIQRDLCQMPVKKRNSYRCGPRWPLRSTGLNKTQSPSRL